MPVQHDSGANGDAFIGLKLVKGKEWMGKDSGERGMQLEDSMKDCVPNPETSDMPVPTLRRTGQHQK